MEKENKLRRTAHNTDTDNRVYVHCDPSVGAKPYTIGLKATDFCKRWPIIYGIGGILQSCVLGT